ncbi:hypothetical protein FDECE_13965 [Fusarium decemcellulare]|nr:hypothetical protein FDECE_13965 [Fusarium decemcellulare]
MPKSNHHHPQGNRAARRPAPYGRPFVPPYGHQHDPFRALPLRPATPVPLRSVTPSGDPRRLTPEPNSRKDEGHRDREGSSRPNHHRELPSQAAGGQRGGREPPAAPAALARLTMVDSMVLESVKVLGNLRAPGLSVHSNSRGGGSQNNIFTKVPNVQSTIAFKVESEEALIQAYRQAKAMNPLAQVGGVMFAVASKTENTYVDVAPVDWSALSGRHGLDIRRAPRERFYPPGRESYLVSTTNFS